MPFSELVKVFAATGKDTGRVLRSIVANYHTNLAKAEARREKQGREKVQDKDNFFPIMRLLLPQVDRARSSYNLKQVRISLSRSCSLALCLSLPHTTHSHAHSVSRDLFVSPFPLILGHHSVDHRSLLPPLPPRVRLTAIRIANCTSHLHHHRAQSSMAKLFIKVLGLPDRDAKKLEEWNDVSINPELSGDFPALVQDVANSRIVGAAGKRDFKPLTVGEVGLLVLFLKRTSLPFSLSRTRFSELAHCVLFCITLAWVVVEFAMAHVHALAHRVCSSTSGWTN